MEKLKEKRGAKRSRFSLVANTLRRMLGENKRNVTAMFLENLKENLNDLQRLDRAVQKFLDAEDMEADRVQSESYRHMYEQLSAVYQKYAKKHDHASDTSAVETFQVLSGLGPDTTPESTLTPNVFHQPGDDISECSPDSSREPTPPSPGNVLSPANKSWDQLVNQIEALEDSLPPQLEGDHTSDTPDTPDTRDTWGTHRHTIRWYLRSISLTRLLVALSDDVRPERLPARDWRRVQRALAAPPFGADRLYVIKNSFLLQRPLDALWATLHAVRRHHVERCSAARAGEGAARRLQRWRAAHRDYCAGGARGSVLLLQRRWHELRLLARAWARAGEGGAGEGARLLRELCRTFPHVVLEEPQRWQELLRAGELDLESYDNGNSEYSDEEDGKLVIDEGAMEARVAVDARLGVGRDSLSGEDDDVIDKLHQIDPAQIKTVLIFDSDSEMDVKDVDTSPGGAELEDGAGELPEENCSPALRPVPPARDRLVFEEDDAVGGSGACGGGSVVNSEVNSEPSAVVGEGEPGGGVAGSEDAVVAAPTSWGVMDLKLTMEARVPLVRVDELPTWGERARGQIPRLGGAGERRDGAGTSSRGEGSPRGKYAGKCEQLLSVCRPVSVLLERLPLDAAGEAGGGCGVGCRCAGVAGGARCGRVVLPHLAQVLAQRRRLRTAQVAPLLRDCGTTPAPEGGNGEHTDDLSSESWPALDLDAEKSYEPEEMLVRTRSPAVRGARGVKERGAELLRRLHCQLLACLQLHRLTGEGATRGGEPGAGPPTSGENFEDRVKKKDSKKKKVPPSTRRQDRAKRIKKAKVKVKPAPEAKDPPTDERNEYERWLEERNRGSLMYGFKPREVKTRKSREPQPTEPARKKTLLNSHETVAAGTDKAIEGSGEGKAVEGGVGVNQRGFLRVVPLASLQGPSPWAAGREERHNEAVVDLCDESEGEEQSTASPPSLGGSPTPCGRLVVQPVVSHYNVFLEPIGPHDQSSVAQIPVGQILVPQNPEPQSSIPQNTEPQSSISQNPVPQNSMPLNPVSENSITQNPVPPRRIPQNVVPQSALPQSRVSQIPKVVEVRVRGGVARGLVARPARSQGPPIHIYSVQAPVSQSSISQNPEPQSSIPQNPEPQSSITQNPVPQSSISQNPLPQNSIPQNPVSQNSIPQNPVSQNSIPQNPVSQSSISHNPVPQNSIPQNPVSQNSIPQNPVSQSSISQNPVPQNSIPQNPLSQNSIPQNPVSQSSISHNPVPQNSIPQNPVSQNSIPQNPVSQNSIPQNPVSQSSISQNPVPQNAIPQNPVSQNSIPQNPVPQCSIPQNSVSLSSIPQNVHTSTSIPQNVVPQSALPQSRVSQIHKVVKFLVPRDVARGLAARPPRSQGHRNQAPSPPIRVYSLPAHSSTYQNAINQTSPSQGHLGHIRVFQTPVARPRKVSPPQYRYYRPLAPRPLAPRPLDPRPLQETRLSTPTPLVTGNSTPVGLEPQVVETAPPAAHPPWARSGEPTPAAPQPPWAKSGEPTSAPPQPPWLRCRVAEPGDALEGGPGDARGGGTGEALGGGPGDARGGGTGDALWGETGDALGGGPGNARGGGLEVGVLPLTERNLALHNKIFSKSRNTRLK